MPTKTPKKTPTRRKPRTHKFEKVIVTEGRYLTSDADGKSTYKDVTGDRLDKVVKTFSTMSEKGLKVPAPWRHDFGITAFSKLEEGNRGLLEDSSKNAGFWSNLFTRTNEEGKKELVGEIEVPGDPNDADTPAGKIGTTVQETSIYLRSKHPLTDDSNEVLEDVPMHIALVTHPIEPGQKNFELKDSEYSIAMSQLVVDSDLGEVILLLEKAVGVYLPASTTQDTLPSNLSIALNQILKSKDSGELDGKDGSPTSKFEMEPIVMAKLDQEQLDALVKAGVVNPKTNKPFTADDLKDEGIPPSQEPTKAEIVMSAMQNAMQDDRRKGYRARINTLVETGRTTKEFAESHLYPKADNYELNFSGNNIAPSEIETVIMSLEAAPSPVQNFVGDELDEKLTSHGFLDTGGPDESQMDSIADAILMDQEYIDV